MKRTLILLLVTLCSVLAPGLVPRSSAQEGKAKDPDALVTDSRLKQMDRQLGLSDEQKQKIRPVLLEEVSGIRAARENGNVPLAQRLAKVDELRAACRAKVKPILTPEQYTAWTATGKKRSQQQPPPGKPEAAPAPPKNN